MISKAIEVRIEQIQKTNENSGLRFTDKDMEQVRHEWDQERVKLERMLNEERVVNAKTAQDLDDLKVKNWK